MPTGPKTEQLYCWKTSGGYLDVTVGVCWFGMKLCTIRAIPCQNKEHNSQG